MCCSTALSAGSINWLPIFSYTLLITVQQHSEQTVNQGLAFVPQEVCARHAGMSCSINARLQPWRPRLPGECQWRNVLCCIDRLSLGREPCRNAREHEASQAQQSRERARHDTCFDSVEGMSDKQQAAALVQLLCAGPPVATCRECNQGGTACSALIPSREVQAGGMARGETPSDGRCARSTILCTGTLGAKVGTTAGTVLDEPGQSTHRDTEDPGNLQAFQMVKPGLRRGFCCRTRSPTFRQEVATHAAAFCSLKQRTKRAWPRLAAIVVSTSVMPQWRGGPQALGMAGMRV